MQRMRELAFAANPEIRFAILAEARRGRPTGINGGRHFHDQLIAERRKRLGVESLRAFVIGYCETHVIDHALLPL